LFARIFNHRFPLNSIWVFNNCFFIVLKNQKHRFLKIPLDLGYLKNFFLEKIYLTKTLRIVLGAPKKMKKLWKREKRRGKILF